MYRVPSSERRFYGGMILSLAAVVFIGFAPSFYLRSMLGSGRPLAPLLIAHGVVFSTWLLLLAAQSALITSHRQDVHRKLGVLGLALAPAMVVLGFATALTLAARLVRTQGAIAAGHAALAMLDLPVFAGLFVAAFLLRRRSQAHKRLMLLATVALVGAAVNRLPLPVYLAGRFPRFLITDLYCLSLILWDLRFAGRVHVATIAGASAIILDQTAQAILWHAEGWSDWVVRLLQVLKP